MKRLYPDWQDTTTENRPPTWNLAPTAKAWTIREIESSPSLSLLKWGFTNEDEPRAMAPINARLETVAEKYLFRSAWQKQRCLVPADGWYEWKNEGGAKQPYFFYREDGEPIYFAGIWTGQTFAMLTTEADGTLTTVHHRKPVSLTGESCKEWLHAPLPADRVNSICEKAVSFKFHPVSTNVNNWRNNSAELMNPL